MRPSQYVPFTFTVEHDAEQAYVLLRSAEGGAVQLAEMQKARDGNWELTLRLRAGTYLHRFYVEVDGVTVVLPGWAVTPCVGRDGFDGVIELVQSEPGPAVRNCPLTSEEQRYVTHS